MTLPWSKKSFATMEIDILSASAPNDNASPGGADSEQSLVIDLLTQVELSIQFEEEQAP